MTTIAYDGKTICADTLACWGSERGRAPIEKIITRASGIYALSGSFAVRDEVIDWIENGAKRGDAPNLVGDEEWQVIFIDKDGAAYFGISVSPGLVPIVAPFTIGSGGEFALGAMLAGKSAHDAVKIAAILDIKTGDNVQIVHLK